MKKLIVFFSLILSVGCIRAQTPTTIPPYSIVTSDSMKATPASLKHRRTMLIYFSPDCPHCQHLTMDMKPKMKEFGDTQIVMITWSNNYDIRAIKNFVKDYDLKKYPNITVGTEGYSYLVQKYYKIQTTPFVAIFNSNGHLVKSFTKDPEVSDLIKAVKTADTVKKAKAA
ncbi:MAG: thioredoxin-like domain-containing protein [Bacteroidota bacterium]